MTAPTASKTARDLMHSGVDCIQSTDTIATTSAAMSRLGVGCLPVCGPEDKLMGMITDRDIVVDCVAEGKDTTVMTAADLAKGRPVWVDANASKDEVLAVMSEHQVRRLPVMDHRRLVGMISEYDLVRGLDRDDVADFCKAVYR
ncbi:MAG: CBS domain-containing protein [Streptomyces sp.]|jgi:CBS domain-containing protein|nr:CBS domain-containing protein [Streptomyces sp.]